MCHETNLKKSKEFKTTKYRNLNSNLKSEFDHLHVKVFTIEVSSLGFIAGFDTFCRDQNIAFNKTSFSELYTNIFNSVISQSCNNN